MNEQTARIFCQGGTGTILETVQSSEIYSDSKTFVDLKLKHDPQTVLNDWKLFIQ